MRETEKMEWEKHEDGRILSMPRRFKILRHEMTGGNKYYLLVDTKTNNMVTAQSIREAKKMAQRMICETAEKRRGVLDVILDCDPVPTGKEAIIAGIRLVKSRTYNTFGPVAAEQGAVV